MRAARRQVMRRAFRATRTLQRRDGVYSALCRESSAGYAGDAKYSKGSHRYLSLSDVVTATRGGAYVIKEQRESSSMLREWRGRAAQYMPAKAGALLHYRHCSRQLAMI